MMVDFRELNGADVPFSGNSSEDVYSMYGRNKRIRSIPDRLVFPSESWQVQFFEETSKKKSCNLKNCSLRTDTQQYDGWNLQGI